MELFEWDDATATERQSRPGLVCPNCNEPGPHYVPPSLKADGFFICDGVPE